MPFAVMSNEMIIVLAQYPKNTIPAPAAILIAMSMMHIIAKSAPRVCAHVTLWGAARNKPASHFEHAKSKLAWLFCDVCTHTEL